MLDLVFKAQDVLVPASKLLFDEQQLIARLPTRFYTPRKRRTLVLQRQHLQDTVTLETDIFCLAGDVPDKSRRDAKS